MVKHDTALELLEINKEILIINILDYVVAIDSDPYLISLKDPEEGIYLTGSMEPIFSKSNFYITKDKFNKPMLLANDILDLETILSATNDVYDISGNLIMTAEDIRKKSKYLRLAPTIPVIGVKMGVATVLKYLNSLCVYTHVSSSKYNQESLVKEEALHLVNSEEYDIAFESLLDRVAKFIGKDTWHIYFYKVRGTNLIIQKTVDFRIYQWYQWKIEKEKKDDDDS